jgi:hypothetical protein
VFKPLGFPEHYQFILYAPEIDRSLGLRNWLAYNAARRMGRYAMRTLYAEVFLVQVTWGHVWGGEGRHSLRFERSCFLDQGVFGFVDGCLEPC